MLPRKPSDLIRTFLGVVQLPQFQIRHTAHLADGALSIRPLRPSTWRSQPTEQRQRG